jgi:hypothetical protein
MREGRGTAKVSLAGFVEGWVQPSHLHRVHSLTVGLKFHLSSEGGAARLTLELLHRCARSVHLPMLHQSFLSMELCSARLACKFWHFSQRTKPGNHINKLSLKVKWWF